MQKKKEEGIIDSSDKEIVAEAERLDVKAMGPLVLTEVLFNEKIREQIKKYRRHFLRVSELFCVHCEICRCVTLETPFQPPVCSVILKKWK